VNDLERSAREGDGPVAEILSPPEWILSTAFWDWLHLAASLPFVPSIVARV